MRQCSLANCLLACLRWLLPFFFRARSRFALFRCFNNFFIGSGADNPAAVADGEEVFQAKVHTRNFGRRGMDGLMFAICNYHKIDVSQDVALDGEGFDIALDLPGLEEPVLLLANGDAVTGYFVSSLFQGEALVFGSACGTKAV